MPAWWQTCRSRELQVLDSVLMAAVHLGRAWQLAELADQCTVHLLSGADEAPATRSIRVRCFTDKLSKLRHELMWGAPATASHEQCVASEDDLFLGTLLLTEEANVSLRVAASSCTMSLHIHVAGMDLSLQPLTHAVG